jgi:hypothetical protein
MECWSVGVLELVGITPLLHYFASPPRRSESESTPHFCSRFQVLVRDKIILHVIGYSLLQSEL